MTAVSTDILLSEYAPQPMVRLDAHVPTRAKFDAIDAHNHLGGGVFGDSDGFPRWPVDTLLGLMDEVGIQAILDLDGGFGDRLKSELHHYQEPHPDRFFVFAGIDYDNFAEDPDFGATEAQRLRESVAMGARGLKVWKVLGLRLRDSQGLLIPIDDERLDSLWQTAADLNVPVLIHIADPVAFFRPLDRFNERFEELHNHPDWHFYPIRPEGDRASQDFPSFDELMGQFERLIRRHSATRFIGAHAGCYAENLGWVGRVMADCPNFYMDISARIAELGRQPYTARDFFMKHQDRILFGTDSAPNMDVYQTYFRFLETRDEYFSYGKGDPPNAGRWQIYGLDLPDEVLRKVYSENAHRVLCSQ